MTQPPADGAGALIAALASQDPAELGRWLGSRDMPLCGADWCAFFVRADCGEAVEVWGDWNGWAAPLQPRPLAALPEWLWAVVAADPRQVIAYKLKIDGAWCLDPGNPHIAFGAWGLNSAIYPPGRSRLRRLSVAGIDGAAPREVFVYLPAAYFSQPRQAFAAVYWQDGFNVFANPQAPFGSWDLDRSSDALIAAGQIAPLNHVAVDTRDREREYAWAPLHHPDLSGAPLLPAYARWLVEVLKPRIDATFRTLPGREATAIAGSSLGGNAALWTAWQHWQVFAKVAALSPALWVGEGVAASSGHLGEGPSLRQIIAANRAGVPSGGLRVYLDCGDSEDDGRVSYASDSWVHCDWTRNALIARGWQGRPEWCAAGAPAQIPANLPEDAPPAAVPALAWQADPPEGQDWAHYLGLGRDLLMVVGQGHRHDEAAWRLRTATALRFLFPGPALAEPRS